MSAEREAFQLEHRRMTNWQRHQWVKAGRPGAKEFNVEKLQPFLRLFHWKHAERARLIAVALGLPR